MPLTVYDAQGRPKQSLRGPNVPMDPWHLVGAAGEPPFQNAWVNYDNSATVPGTVGQRNVGFRKYPDGRVRLKGTIKNGAPGTSVFSLPPGYRPLTDIVLTTNGSGGLATVTIGSPASNGVVNPAGTGVGSYVFLDGLEFDSETVLALPGGPMGPAGQVPVVTALPTAPFDGQEIIYRFVQSVQIVSVNGADPQVLLWRLRYDAAVGKWLPVGSQEPVCAYDGGSHSQSFGAGWSQFTGAVLSISVPLPGIYRFKFGANYYYNNTSSNNQIGLYDGPTATWGGLNLYTYAPGTVNNYNAAHASVKRVGAVPAGSGWTWGTFPSGGGTVGAAGLYIEAYPVQIG